jgi:hypothetical protein
LLHLPPRTGPTGGAIEIEALSLFVHDYASAKSIGCTTQAVTELSPEQYNSCYSFLGKYCQQQQPGQRCDFKEVTVTFYDATYEPLAKVPVAKAMFGSGLVMLAGAVAVPLPTRNSEVTPPGENGLVIWEATQKERERELHKGLCVDFKRGFDEKGPWVAQSSQLPYL